MLDVMIDVNPFKLIYTSDVHRCIYALLGGNVEGKETSLFRSNRAKGEESVIRGINCYTGKSH